MHAVRGGRTAVRRTGGTVRLLPSGAGGSVQAEELSEDFGAEVGQVGGGAGESFPDGNPVGEGDNGRETRRGEGFLCDGVPAGTAQDDGRYAVAGGQCGYLGDDLAVQALAVEAAFARDDQRGAGDCLLQPDAAGDTGRSGGQRGVAVGEQRPADALYPHSDSELCRVL